MKKITLVVVLLGCIQFQSSYAMGSIPTLRDLFNSGSKPTKEWLEALARSSSTRGNVGRWLVREGAQEVAAETAKVTIKEAGREVAEGAAKGYFWGSVKGIVAKVGVDVVWRTGSTIYGFWQRKSLNAAKDNFYRALEKNKDNELNILTGFPKGCEKEIETLLKLPGGQEFLEYYLNRLYAAYNKKVEKR